MAPTFRLTGNQQTRLSLTTYFWSLKDPWLGASSSAYKQPGALHTPHAYTLARCFGLQSRLLSSFPLSSSFVLFFLCLSPLCASARLVVLKRVRYEPFKVKKRGAADPSHLRPLLLLLLLWPYRHPHSLQPSRYRPTCNHGSGWSPRCKTMPKSRLLTSRVASAGRAGLVGNIVRGPERHVC